MSKNILGWACGLVATLFSMSAVGVDKYQHLKGINCSLQSDAKHGMYISLDSNGNLKGRGVTLTCGGKQVALINGKISNGLIETKDFGKIKVEYGSGISINVNQIDKFRKMFK